MARPRRMRSGKARRSAVLPISLLLVGVACGSHHDEAAFVKANAELLKRADVSSDSGASPSMGGTSDTTPGATSTVADGGSGSDASTARPAFSGGVSTVAPATNSGSASRSGPAATERASVGTPSRSAAPGGSPTPVSGGGSAVHPPGSGDPGSAGPKSEIVLGSVGTDTGPAATPLTGIRDAARAWVADVNSRGGLNGHPVRLILGDDGGDPARAQAIVKRMVESDKVQALYATRGFLTETAYMAYLEEKQIPIVGTCVCSPVDGPSPMTFDVSINISPGGAWMHVGPLIALSDKRKVALLYCREAPGCTLVRDDMKKYSKEWGFELVYETQNSIGQPDFTAEVIAARNSGADALISVNDGATSIRVLRSMHRQGWNPAFSAQPSHHDDRFLVEGGKDVEGILVSSVTVPYDRSPKMSDYRTAMDRWAPGGVRSSLGASSGFLAGKLLERISGRFATTVTTRDILAGLYSLKAETLDGRIYPVTYPAGKPHNLLNLCIVPMTIKGGKYDAPKGDAFSCAPGFQS